MTIIERILDLLNQKNMSVNRFSKEINVNQRTVSNWKNRNSNPPAELIMPICELLGVTPTYLLTGEQETTAIGYRERLTEEEHLLLTMFRKLDEDGRVLVTAAAIREQRIQAENQKEKENIG